MIKVGTCGFTYKHFRYFDVIEVQQTFYDIVNENTLKKWKEKGSNVEFTLKAFQVITHTYNTMTYKKMKSDIGLKENFGSFKPTKEVEKAYEITLAEAKSLGAKIIVFQTPSSFLPTEENIGNLKNFFSSADSSFIHAWEPRGEEWYKDDILSKIFSEINIVHVVDPFKHKSLTSKKYYRLHGLGKGEVNYNYKYTDNDLLRLSEMVKGDNNEIYVMFNNVYSFDDALRFKKLLKDLNVQ